MLKGKRVRKQTRRFWKIYARSIGLRDCWKITQLYFANRKPIWLGQDPSENAHKGGQWLHAIPVPSLVTMYKLALNTYELTLLYILAKGYSKRVDVGVENPSNPQAYTVFLTQSTREIWTTCVNLRRDLTFSSGSRNIVGFWAKWFVPQRSL